MILVVEVVKCVEGERDRIPHWISPADVVCCWWYFCLLRLVIAFWDFFNFFRFFSLSKQKRPRWNEKLNLRNEKKKNLFWSNLRRNSLKSFARELKKALFNLIGNTHTQKWESADLEFDEKVEESCQNKKNKLIYKQVKWEKTINW